MLNVAAVLLLTCISLAGIVVIWRLALRRPDDGGQRCGGCGYLVEGLEAPRCPECGADFADVGIRGPRRRAIHPVVFIGLWLFFVTLSAVPLTQLAIEHGPRFLHFESRMTVETKSGSVPPIKIIMTARAPMAPSATGYGINGPTIGTVSDGHTSTVTITPATLTGAKIGSFHFELRVPDGSDDASIAAIDPLHLDVVPAEGDGAVIDVDTLAGWLDGAPRDAVSRRDDLTDLSRLVGALSRATTFSTTRLGPVRGVSTIAQTKTPVWYRTLVVGTAVAILIGGLLAYVVAERRRR